MTQGTRNIIVYRDILLPPSERFILSQGESLSVFNAFYFGSRKVSGIEVPSDRCCVVNNGGWIGKCREVLFKVFDRVLPAQLVRLSKLQPLLIHAHFGPDGVLANTLARELRLPLVVTFHGFDATVTDDFAKRSFYTHRKYLRRKGALIGQCSKFIAVSDFIRRRLLEQGFPEEKIVTHYIGIDLEEFQPQVQIPREPIVLFVGRLVEKKGCSYLIKAMQKVQASLPEVQLVVIGDGALRRQLEAEAGQCLKKYRFLGVQPAPVVRQWLNKAKVLSVPSITAKSGDAEGLGLVFVEAQAMGVPVVSFLSGGIPEAVCDGQTGFLLPEKDWDGLALRISELFSDDMLWVRMSAAAQERVKVNFNLRKQNKILEQIYSDVLGTH